MWRRRRAQQAANVCFPSSNPHAAASDMHPPQDARLFTACNKNPSLPGCPYTPPVCACVFLGAAVHLAAISLTWCLAPLQADIYFVATDPSAGIH